MAAHYEYTLSFTYQGKRYKVRANTKEELYEKKANRIRDLKDGIVILDSRTTVDTWAENAFHVYKKNVSGLPEMLLRYNKYIKPFLGSLPIASVKSMQCQSVLNECEGMSFSHCSKLRQELSFIFQTAVDNEMILKNPAAKLTLPECVKGSRRSITDHERKHLQLVFEQYSPFILFMLMLRCGCRPTEAMNLIGRDIDHEQKLLHIRGTKTVNSDRYVPIPDDLYPMIRNTKPFDPIAPNNAGKIHTESSYRNIRDRLKRELNLSMGCKTYRNALIPPYPLSEDFNPYCLRHTYCTDLCRAGVDVRTAQKLMGHSSITITADIYTHVDLGEIMKAGEMINSYHASRKMIAK